MTADPSPTATSRAAGYRERLWPAPSGWLLAPLAGVLLAVTFWPIGAAAGLIAGLVATLLGVLVTALAAPVVEVSGGELRAGDAHVPLGLLGEVQALDVEQTRYAVGPGLDARAHLCLRGWVRTAVQVELVDPTDPTPYWVVSSRHPAALAGAVRRVSD